MKRIIAAERQDASFSTIKGYEDVLPDKTWTITFNTDVPGKYGSKSK